MDYITFNLNSSNFYDLSDKVNNYNIIFIFRKNVPQNFLDNGRSSSKYIYYHISQKEIQYKSVQFVKNEL